MTSSFSLHDGKAGIVSRTIQRYLLDKDEELLTQAMEMIRSASGEFLRSPYVPDSLYEGRAGVLLVLLCLYKLTGAPFLLDDIISFTKRLLANARLRSDGVCWEGDDYDLSRQPDEFAYGTDGIVYVLIQVGTIFPRVLDPVIDGAAQYLGSISHLDDEAARGGGVAWIAQVPGNVTPGGPFLSDRNVQEALLQPLFPRTIGLLESRMPESVALLYEGLTGVQAPAWPQHFMSFVDDFLAGIDGESIRPCLEDIYGLERARYHLMCMRGRPGVQTYLEEIRRQDAVVSQLNNPRSWLLDRTLQLSPAVRIIDMRWNWAEVVIPEDPASYDRILTKAEGDFQVLLEPSEGSTVTETELSTAGLILRRFETPRTVRQAFTGIKSYCRSCDDKELELLAKGAGARDVPDFMGRMDYLVLQKIREFIFRGTLITL